MAMPQTVTTMRHHPFADRAVAAARRTFEGPWSKMKPYERQHILLKLADLVEKHMEELSTLDTLDMGAPISRTRDRRPKDELADGPCAAP